MAKDNIGLLNEIVGQLRKLNQFSVRDKLQENEALKRSESLLGQGEVAEEGQSSLISDAQDFQRRFIAGQAKTFSDAKLTNTLLGKQKPSTLYNQEKLVAINTSLRNKSLHYLFGIESILDRWDKGLFGKQSGKLLDGPEGEVIEGQYSVLGDNKQNTEILAKLEGPLLALENLGDKQPTIFLLG